MKLQLTIEHGGFGGTIRLKPIETEEERLGIPKKLLDLIESGRLSRLHEPLDTTKATPSYRLAPEDQIYHLTVTGPDGDTMTYRFPKEQVERHREVKDLLDFIWQHAKPAPE